MNKNNLMRTVTMALAGIMAAAMLSGCGSGSSNSSAAYTAPEMEMAAESASYDDGLYTSYTAASADYDYDYDFVEEEMEAPAAGGASGSASQAANQQSSRKLIKNMDYNVETEDLDGLDNAIRSKTAELGGYIESSHVDGVKYDKEYYENLYKNSTRRVYNTRYASYTVRIPVENLDRFCETLEEKANVTSSNLNVRDITLQYVDVESHISSLREQQKRLNEMMEKAETVEEMIEIESALSDVRYELQNYQSQMNVYNNQVSYSTVDISVQEVTKLSEMRELTDGERLRKGFVDNFVELMDDIKEFLIWFVIHIPNIILWIVIIYIAYRIWKKLRARRDRGNGGAAGIAVQDRTDKAGRKERKNGKGWLRNNHRTSERGEVHIDEHTDRTEDRDHIV